MEFQLINLWREMRAFHCYRIIRKMKRRKTDPKISSLVNISIIPYHWRQFCCNRFTFISIELKSAAWAHILVLNSAPVSRHCTYLPDWFRPCKVHRTATGVKKLCSFNLRFSYTLQTRMNKSVIRGFANKHN